MTKVCKFQDKPCSNSYFSSKDYKLHCRLDEWKQKKGVCPYDKSIHSRFHSKKSGVDKYQKRLV